MLGQRPKEESAHYPGPHSGWGGGRAADQARGQGRPGERGGPSGDLYVRVHVKPHPVFGRQGSDLTVAIPVTFAELVLGAEVKVPVLIGSPITVRILGGTPNGRASPPFLVRGKGVRRKEGTTGNMRVTVEVAIPANVEGEGRRLVEQLLAVMNSGEREARAELIAAAGARSSPGPSRCVGFDLGTTESTVAVLEGGKPKVIVNAEGSRRTPSVVSFSKSGGVLVGEAAKRQAVTNVDRTIRSVKRHMGTDWSVDIDDENFTPQQISAFVLQKLKRDAEAYLGEKITDAVITVPAYFSDAQRQATKEAGQIAGLNVLRIINEPTAATLAYHLEKDNEATILVFDLGGGTFDVSLLEVGEGVVEVKATSGDNHLGGDDWDQRIVDWLVKDFKAKIALTCPRTRWRCSGCVRPRRRPRSSSRSRWSRRSSCLHSNSSNGPLHLDAKLTRAEFQRMTSDLLDRCKGPFRQVIKDADIKISDVSNVVLIGGSTRMPAVVNLVKSLPAAKSRSGLQSRWGSGCGRLPAGWHAHRRDQDIYSST